MEGSEVLLTQIVRNGGVYMMTERCNQRDDWEYSAYKPNRCHAYDPELDQVFDYEHDEDVE